MIWGDAGQDIVLETVNVAAPPVVTRTPPTRPMIFSPLTVIGAGAAAKMVQTLMRNPTISRRRAFLGLWGWTGNDEENG